MPKKQATRREVEELSLQINKQGETSARRERERASEYDWRIRTAVLRQMLQNRRSEVAGRLQQTEPRQLELQERFPNINSLNEQSAPEELVPQLQERFPSSFESSPGPSPGESALERRLESQKRQIMGRMQLAPPARSRPLYSNRLGPGRQARRGTSNVSLQQEIQRWKDDMDLRQSAIGEYLANLPLEAAQKKGLSQVEEDASYLRALEATKARMLATANAALQ